MYIYIYIYESIDLFIDFCFPPGWGDPAPDPRVGGLPPPKLPKQWVWGAAAHNTGVWGAGAPQPRGKPGQRPAT